MRNYNEYDTEGDGGPYVVIEQRESGLGVFLFGLALGAGAALLLAPQNGEETRRIVRERVRTVSDTARQRADELMDTMSGQLDEVREQVMGRMDAAKAAARRQRNEVFDAFEAGRSAAHVAKLEMERKLAEQRAARRSTEPPAGVPASDRDGTGV